MLLQAGKFAFGIAAIVGGEGTGNVNALGAGHAVSTAGAGHLHLGVDGGKHTADHGLIFGGKHANCTFGGGFDIFLQHFHGVHAGQNAGDLRLIPQPTERPLGRRSGHGMCGKFVNGRLRQVVDQFSAPEGFHDNYGDSFGSGVLQTTAAGLGVLIHVVILDLAEIPVIDVDQLAEIFGVAVVGEAYLTDSAGFFLFLQKFQNAHLDQLFPGCHVRQHVHQVIVDVVSLQTGQMLLKDLFHHLPGFDHVVGELGGDFDLVADIVAGQNFAHCNFTAGVNVGGIKVVDAGINGGQQLTLCFFQIDASVLALETHAAEAENGYVVAIFILAVLHKYLPLFV